MEVFSESVSEAEGASGASAPSTLAVGNALVGSGLSFFRERLLPFLPLSDVGLMLDGGGRAWEAVGSCRARSVKRQKTCSYVVLPGSLPFTDLQFLWLPASKRYSLYAVICVSP